MILEVSDSRRTVYEAVIEERTTWATIQKFRKRSRGIFSIRSSSVAEIGVEAGHIREVVKERPV